MGRVMSWLGVNKPGTCVSIEKLEVYNVKLREVWDIKGKFEEFMDSEDLVDMEGV